MSDSKYKFIAYKAIVDRDENNIIEFNDINYYLQLYDNTLYIDIKNLKDKAIDIAQEYYILLNPNTNSTNLNFGIAVSNYDDMIKLQKTDFGNDYFVEIQVVNNLTDSNETVKIIGAVEKTNVSGGGMKKTNEKVPIGNSMRCVYKKPKDRKKYVRMNGKYIPLVEARKSVKK